VWTDIPMGNIGKWTSMDENGGTLFVKRL